MNGLDKAESDFWNSLKEESLRDIEVSIANGRSGQALRSMLCMIDAMAGLFTGRVDNGVEDSWFSFVDRVMKGAKNVNVEGLGLHFVNMGVYSYSRTKRRSGDPKETSLKNCSALLYTVYRTGSIHDGVLPNCFYIFESDEHELWSISDDTEPKIGLNIKELLVILKDSVDRFEKAFDNDPDRAKKFKARYKFLTSRYKLEKTRS